MLSDCTSPYSSSLGYPAIPAIVSLSHTSPLALMSSCPLLPPHSAKNKCFFVLNTPHHFLAAPFSKFFTSWLCSISPTVTNRIVCALHSFLPTRGKAQKRQIGTPKYQSLGCPGPMLHSGYFKTLLLFSIHLAHSSLLTLSRWPHFLCLRENKSLFMIILLPSNLKTPDPHASLLNLSLWLLGTTSSPSQGAKSTNFLFLLNLFILLLFSIRIEK